VRITVESKTAASTRRLGEMLGRAVETVPRAGLTIVLLGDLGAGKTVFAGGVVRGLGAPAGTVVVSPTFTIARGYRGRMPIVHVDAYHVRRLADLEAAGFEEMSGSGRVTVVEWGDRIATALPADRLETTLSPVAAAPPHDAGASPAPYLVDVPRRVEIVARGPESARVLARLAPSLEGDADLSPARDAAPASPS